MRKRSRCQSVRRSSHRSFTACFEPLEERRLLAGLPANTLALFEGGIDAAGETDTVQIHLTPQNFAIGNADGGHITLGFVVQPQDSGLLPEAVQIDKLSGPGNVPVIFEKTGLSDGSSLVLAKLKHGDYEIDITSRNNTIGGWQLQVFLAGDVDGDFVINTADSNLLRQAMQGTPTPAILAVGDINRDGRITGYDLARADTNKGVSTSVRILTVSAGLDPTDDTGLAGDNLVRHTPVDIIGTTQAGATVLLDKDGDGFDDGTTTASAGSPTNYALSAGLIPGANLLRVEARDAFGQTAHAQTTVTLDAIAPTVVSTTPAAGATIDPPGSGNIVVHVIFSEPMIGASVLSSLSVSGNDTGAITPLGAQYNDSTRTLTFEIGQSLTDSNISVTVGATAADLAGNGLAGGSFPFSFNVNRVVGITQISPANGEELVSLTREAIIRFSAPVDPTTVTSNAIQVISLGATVSGRLMVSSTERFVTFFPNQPWNASTEVRIRIDGDRIMGRNGRALDADGDRQPGGHRTADFTTLPLTRIPGTNVFGFVRDSFTQAPIAGVTIRVDAFPQANAVTDANGRFELRDMPAPEFFVHIDGSTAAAPAGFVYPVVGKPFHSVPGQTVQLEMDREPFDIFLPPMALGDIQPLSPTQTTEVGFGNAGRADLVEMFPNLDPSIWDRMQVSFAPGAAVDEFGNRATEAAIIPVPPDRIPAPLPPNLNPELVISIQAGTATNFDIPAPVTFPNLEGLAPGEKSLIFSFDHDAGEWVVIGAGSVSADGLSIVSDVGVGIAAPGWHFTFSGSQNFDLLSPNNGDKDYDTRPIDGATDLAIIAAAEAALLLPLGGTIIGIGGIQVARAFGFSTGDFVHTALHLANFLANTGATLSYPIGSEASDLARADSSVIANHNRILMDVKRELDARVQSGSDDTSIELVLARSQANVRFTTLDLFFAFGGTQGINVEGEVDIVDGRYVGSIRYTYADTYGYGRDDANSFAWPDRFARTLQEYGLARPFRAEVAVEFPIDLPAPVAQQQSIQFKGLLRPAAETLPRSEALGFGNDDRVYYRFILDSGVEVSGTTLSNGQLNGVVLPPRRQYSAYFYQPSTNRSTTLFGDTGASGEQFGFIGSPSAIGLEDFGGVDADGDGLPDVGEIAIGTDPGRVDTDNDGIVDSTEIQQGLDPLDDRGFPTGIISSLPLPGPATEVVVEGDTAYVATGSHGLAVVDVGRFNNPILLGQLDLPGIATDVSAAPELNRVVVTTNSGGVHVVDVAEPMVPTLARTVNVTGSRVEVVDGVAFVANGGSLTAIDMLTGDILQSLNLGGGTITDIAKEGTFLYTIDNGRSLTAIDVSTGDMDARGSVFLPNGGGKLFVGNGIAYAAAANTSAGGFATANVSNPDAPTVISGSDAPVESVPGTAIVTNGSGIGLLIGQSQRVAGDPSSLNLVDISDPANTYDFLTQINLPAPPQGLAVASGLAFVANGTAGLQVINYLPFDNRGQAPTVNIETSVADVDPATPGIQVLEGTSIPIRADVLDEVQVRNVELLVNGTVVRNDVSFPFDFFAVAPNITPEASSVSLQVRATDTGGNAALSNVLTIHLVRDTFAPSIVSIAPPDGATGFEGLRSVRIRFSEPMDAATINTSNLSIVEAGSDAAFGTGDDMPVNIINLQLRSDDSFVQLTTNPLPIGSYQVQIAADQITDRAGNRLGAGDIVSQFTLEEFSGPIAKTNNTTGVVDRSSAARSVSFTAEDFGGASVVADVNVVIDFMKHDGESFGIDRGGCAFNNEIFFILRSPSGQSVTFIPTFTYSEICPPGGRVLVTYDDEAETAASGMPRSGSFRPPIPLSAFDGEDGIGVWTVTIGDSVGADALSFWSVTVVLNSEASLVGPSSLLQGETTNASAIESSLDDGTSFADLAIFSSAFKFGDSITTSFAAARAATVLPRTIDGTSPPVPFWSQASQIDQQRLDEGRFLLRTFTGGGRRASVHSAAHDRLFAEFLDDLLERRFDGEWSN
ncbi:MAG: Ig-like domain-containing protein [Pirellulales bacterium]